MKKSKLLFMYIWPIMEYFIYSLLSMFSCEFGVKITDYGYELHIITCILLEIYFLIIYKQKIIKICVLIHFLIFIVLFFSLSMNIKLIDLFIDFPTTCAINIINKIE